jgi:hypothetical protein
MEHAQKFVLLKRIEIYKMFTFQEYGRRRFPKVINQ